MSQISLKKKLTNCRPNKENDSFSNKIQMIGFLLCSIQKADRNEIHT